MFKATLEEAQKNNQNITEEEKEKIRKDVISRITQVDAQVSFGSYITQNPEMEKLSANFFEKVLGTNVGNFARGKVFFLAGYGTKWLSRSMAATGVGVGVAAAVGGAMAYRKKNLELNENDLRQRYGKEVKDLIVKKPVSFKNAHERLAKLVDQFEKDGKDEKSKNRILETIKTRIFVTDEMVREKRVDFGNPKEATYNQYKLTSLVAKATMLVQENGGFNEEKTEEEKVFDRFKQFVEDEKITRKRKEEIISATLKGAGVGALGFSLGAGVRWLQEKGYFGAAWESISESINDEWSRFSKTSSLGVSAGISEAKKLASEGVLAWESAKESGAKVLDKLKDSVKSVGGVAYDYLNGDEAALDLDQASNAAKTAGEALPPEVPNPKVETFESIEVGKRGMIGGIDELQDKLNAKFGKNIPDQYKEFMSKNPEEIAREWGAYRPGESNESAKVFKGAKFEIDKNGEVRFVDHLGQSQKVFTPEVGTSNEFAGEFFDSGNGSENLSSTDLDSGYETSESDYESPQRPQALNEGYVRSSEVKPDTSSWYEKPVPTEYGTSGVRGSWKFVEDVNGKITDVNLARTISDRANQFLRTPNKFINPDALGTDSTKVYNLRQNSARIVELIKTQDLLNDSSVNILEEQRKFLENKILEDGKKIEELTKGAFNNSYKPPRVSVFETDAIKPRINPSVTSVSEGSDFVPGKAESVKPGSDNLYENIKTISSTPEEKTFSFNTDDIKGKLRFIFNKEGEIVNLQESASMFIRGSQNINSVLVDDWQTKVTQGEGDPALAIKKVNIGIKHLQEYKTLLKSRAFSEGSKEYEYIKRQIEYTAERYKDILK
ncbi:MAG: hypothetical protein R3B55_00835 [Candidatus Paceibacterota bacterium]